MNVDPRFSPDQLLHRATVKRREAHALMEMAETVKRCLETEHRGVFFAAHVAGPGKSWGDLCD